MASGMDVGPLSRMVRSGKFLNKHLIAICGQDAMSKTGVKADLQQRIIDSKSRLPRKMALVFRAFHLMLLSAHRSVLLHIVPCINTESRASANTPLRATRLQQP